MIVWQGGVNLDAVSQSIELRKYKAMDLNCTFMKRISDKMF